MRGAIHISEDRQTDLARYHPDDPAKRPVERWRISGHEITRRTATSIACRARGIGPCTMTHDDDVIIVRWAHVAVRVLGKSYAIITEPGDDIAQ